MTAFGPPIPGETPLDDISGLRISSIRTRADLNASEALNIRKAVVKYLVGRPSARLAPFSYEWLLRLHQEMFGDVWSWAGTLRRSDTNIGVAWVEIPVHLHQLVADIAAWTDLGMPMDEQAARLHHRSVHIHPFPNGNGRWSRMAANIWLSRNGHPFVNWPEETVGTASVIRDEYLAAIRAADAGNYNPLLAMHRRYPT